MKHQFFLTLAVLTLMISNQTLAESLIAPKIGYSDWGQQRVNIDGTNMDMVRSESAWFPFGRNALGIEYKFLFDFNLAIGGEFNYETFDVKNDPGGYIHVYRYMGVAKYYFPSNSVFRPYIGAAYGDTSMSINSIRNATLRGHVRMAKVGFDLNFSPRIGIGFEFRNTDLTMNDDYNNSMSSNNQEVFFKLNFRSRPRNHYY